MDANVIGILSLLAALVTFLYGLYRVVKKDSDVRRDKVVNQLEACVRENAATKESIKRLNQRIETVEHQHEKLESSVEKMMDKLDIKLDKIMTFLLDNRS